MDRPTHSKARLALAIVAALAALTAISVPSAVAAPPAGEEYVLELPGVRQTNNPAVAPEPTAIPGESRAQQGVVGESSPPQSPLAATASTLGSIPASLVAGLAALLALALLSTLTAVRLRTREAR